MKNASAASKVKEILVLSGTVLNYVIFLLLFLFLEKRYTLNLVLYHLDTVSGSLIDHLYSTLLFVSACVWILIAVKLKARASLAFSAGVMLCTSVIAVGAGLFQPFFDIFFGGLGGTAAHILVCLFDKAAHIFLGCISIKYFNALGKKEDNPQKPLKRIFIVIPLAVGLAASAFLIIPNIPPLFVDAEEMSEAVEDEESLKKAVGVYEELNRENIITRIENSDDNDSLKQAKSVQYAFGEYTVDCYADEDGSLSKKYSSSCPISFEPFDIEKLSAGESREEFSEKMPLGCAKNAYVSYHTDGTADEVIEYACRSDRNYYEYRFVFENGKLAYGSAVTRKDSFLYRVDSLFDSLTEMPMSDKKEIGDKKYG